MTFKKLVKLKARMEKDFKQKVTFDDVCAVALYEETIREKEEDKKLFDYFRKRRPTYVR